MGLRKLAGGWYEVDVRWSPEGAAVPYAVHLSHMHGIGYQAPGLTWLYTPARILEVDEPYAVVMRTLGLVPAEGGEQ